MSTTTGASGTSNLEKTAVLSTAALAYGDLIEAYAKQLGTSNTTVASVLREHFRSETAERRGDEVPLSRVC